MSEYAFLKATKPPVSKAVGRSVKVQWHGLNMNAHADSGYIVDGENFYVTADGTLRAVDVPELFDDAHTGTPLAFYGIDGKLFYVYNKGNNNVDIVRFNDLDNNSDYSSANLSNDNKLSSVARSLARYNVWSGNSDIVNGKYKPRLLIYPDAKWLDFNKQWYTTTAIKRYRIIKTVTTKRSINQKKYNTRLTSGSPVNKGEWFYSDNDNAYFFADKADGENNSIETDTSTKVYGYADENNEEEAPETETVHGETTTSYSVSTAMDFEGNEFEMLTVETISSTTTASYYFEETGDDIPSADYITAHGNRIFGVSGTKIFASAAGSYVNYDLDTATDFDENNAWYSATQSGGDFTHICTYGGRPVAFKADMLYELYNSKNPYRPKEISKIGAFSGKSVHEVDSTLIYANKDGIYAYGGSYPYCISDAVIDRKKIAGGKFKYGVAGSHEGRYFIREPLVNEDGKPVLVFDTGTKTWSVTNVFDHEICYFAESDGGLYAALNDGKIYRMDTGNKEGTVWYFETPVITEGTADKKVLEKIQLVAKFRTAGFVNVSVKYDNGEYEQIGKLEKSTGVHPLYCKVRKSDHVVRYIRFDCVGDVELLTFEQGVSNGGAT